MARETEMRLPCTIYTMALYYQGGGKHLLLCPTFRVSGRRPLGEDESKARAERMAREEMKEKRYADAGIVPGQMVLTLWTGFSSVIDREP